MWAGRKRGGKEAFAFAPPTQEGSGNQTSQRVRDPCTVLALRPQYTKGNGDAHIHWQARDCICVRLIGWCYGYEPHFFFQDTLLNEEERAVLYELDQTFLQDDEEEKKPPGCCWRVLHICGITFSDKGVISLMASLFIMVIGVVLLVVAQP